MAPTTPYTNDLDGREPLASMRETVDRIRSLASQWSPAQFEGSYAPGKWSARQILIHLAQTEVALGNRARMALATTGYVAQAFDQDVWMARESTLSGREALEAFTALSAMNCAFFQTLSTTDRAAPFSHPEYGALTID